MFCVKLNGKQYNYNTPASLAEILREHCADYAVAALVNNRLYDLVKVIDYDCEVYPISLCDEEGVRIYTRTLKYILIMAARKCFTQKNVKVQFMYSLSRGQYCELVGTEVNDETVSILCNEMKKIIDRNIPFEKLNITKERAQQIYSELGYEDKRNLLEYRPEPNVHLYRCGDEVNYLYGYLLPSTGYIRDFSLVFNSPGIVLMYPRHELGGEVPQFEPSVKFDSTMWRTEEWGKTCNVRTVADLNRTIESGNIKKLVNMCEVRHENQIEKITDEIMSDISNIKIILISGPSSSGKTSLSRRLQTHLAVRGIRSIPVSMDDYYKERDLIKPDENGEYDYEHIEMLNVERFNRDLVDLIAGRQVQLPKYDFAKGKTEAGEVIKMGMNEPLIIEGIHGLNESITRLIPRYNKYKIYISALPHINLDYHNPISTTSSRLIRRMVRDNQFRGTGAQETIAMWESVRRGEFKWIYPYQEEANFIFNSELTYELAVLKKYAEPLIENISRQSKYFISINKMQKFLKYIISIEDDVVPCTSILREFIGGSNYV